MSIPVPTTCTAWPYQPTFFHVLPTRSGLDQSRSKTLWVVRNNHPLWYQQRLQQRGSMEERPLLRPCSDFENKVGNFLYHHIAVESIRMVPERATYTLTRTIHTVSAHRKNSANLSYKLYKAEVEISENCGYVVFKLLSTGLENFRSKKR